MQMLNINRGKIYCNIITVGWKISAGRYLFNIYRSKAVTLGFLTRESRKELTLYNINTMLILPSCVFCFINIAQNPTSLKSLWYKKCAKSDSASWHAGCILFLVWLVTCFPTFYRIQSNFIGI